MTHEAGAHHPIRTRMRARAPDEQHRVSSPLELLFDLTFVVAVASVTAQLAHAMADGHVLDALAPVPPGVLRDLVGVDELHLVRVVLRHRRCAVPAPDDGADGRRARARGGGAGRVQRRRLRSRHARLPDHADRPGRPVDAGGASRIRRAVAPPCATRPGSRSSQVGWLLRLALAQSRGCCRRAGCCRSSWCWSSSSSPCRSWAERTAPTSWHPHHIAERYGLFTIILLG